MTASERRRPVTARDFNRLLFALMLLAALTVLARLVTRQESKAEVQPDLRITLAQWAQWAQTADALFLRGEWRMAADAYYGALEAAATSGLLPEPRWQKKLAICLAETGDERGAVHFMKLYRVRLLQWQGEPSLHDPSAFDSLRDPATLAGEVAEADALIQKWEGSGA